MIGDDVRIGSGAKLLGGIEIGNEVKIGANTIVNNSSHQNRVIILLQEAYV